ncbi:aldehyde dehydrogenase family protein [Burkholderia gladioli]|nr:aldehyde dehydrogenase family protein [Burkholderia gladioli]
MVTDSGEADAGMPSVRAWLANASVPRVAFTCSTPVGRYSSKESAATLKRPSPVPGGNAPFIMFDEAELESRRACCATGSRSLRKSHAGGRALRLAGRPAPRAANQ